MSSIASGVEREDRRRPSLRATATPDSAAGRRRAGIRSPARAGSRRAAARRPSLSRLKCASPKLEARPAPRILQLAVLAAPARTRRCASRAAPPAAPRPPRSPPARARRHAGSSRRNRGRRASGYARTDRGSSRAPRDSRAPSRRRMKLPTGNTRSLEHGEEHRVGHQPRHRDRPPAGPRGQDRVQFAQLGDARMVEPQQVDPVEERRHHPRCRAIRICRSNSRSHTAWSSALKSAQPWSTQ